MRLELGEEEEGRGNSSPFLPAAAADTFSKEGGGGAGNGSNLITGGKENIFLHFSFFPHPDFFFTKRTRVSPSPPRLCEAERHMTHKERRERAHARRAKRDQARRGDGREVTEGQKSIKGWDFLRLTLLFSSQKNRVQISRGYASLYSTFLSFTAKLHFCQL